MAARQGLRFTKEVAATPGVFDASAIPASITLLRMSTPVTDQPKPLTWTIRSAEGMGRKVQTGTAQNETTLKISTELRISQAALLLKAFCTPHIGTGAGLDTFTIDSFHQMDNGTTNYLRRLGMTPETLSLSASNSGQGVLFKADMTFVGRTWDRSITVTDFPLPADADYPTDTPLYFESMAGGVTVATSRTGFSMFNLSVKNVLDLLYDENANPSPKFYGARDVDWSLDTIYKIATDRTKFEAQTAFAVSFAITRAATSVTFNLHAQNFFSNVEDELPFDKAFRQKLSGSSYYDTSAGDDLTLTVDDTP